MYQMDTPESQDIMQRDLNELEERAHGKLIRANQGKYKTLIWVRAAPGVNIGWGMKRLRAALLRRMCWCWWMKSWM